MPTKIAILASGEGSNAQALIDAGSRGELGEAEIALIVSDRSDAGVLDRASSSDIEGLFIDPTDFGGRSAYGEALANALREREIGLVCLGGFMRILAPNFIRAFERKVLNVHPALLPAFPGAHPVKDTLQWGAKLTGATIHFADELADHGPIIFQEALEVDPNDTEESLHGRIKEIEHRLYPRAVRAVVGGRVKVRGRQVTVDEEARKIGRAHV